MLIRNAIVHLVAMTLFGLPGLMGAFAAMGLCVQFWGPQVLHTALASPPDRTQPAFWVFLLVMLPAIVVGCVGGIFTFVVPLYAFFDLRIFNTGPHDRRVFAFTSACFSELMRAVGPGSPLAVPNHALQRTEAGVEAGSEFHA